MPVTIVVGEQRGDEGKGRFVDMLAGEQAIVARFNGGPNAGHTVVLPGGEILELHLLPSGVAHKNAVNIIGNGTYLDPVKLVAEIEGLKEKGIAVTPDNLKISQGAHLIMPHHIQLDTMREDGGSGQGTTKAGIAFVAAEKYQRNGLRAEDILNNDNLYETALGYLSRLNRIYQKTEENEKELVAQSQEWTDACYELKDYLADTTLLVNEALKDGKNVLAEGAQAFLLDIDHGMYPYVTSSSTTTGGVPAGLGISPKYIKRIIGVAKATQSHVGGGPFVTEITDKKLLKNLRGEVGKVDTEQGTTTGRWRRMGHLDLPGLRRAQMINGSTELALTKLDCVGRFGKKVQICTAYQFQGKEVRIAPASAADLEKCRPVYTAMPTWKEDIQHIRKFQDLPAAAQKYVEFVEEQTGVPITMLGVGPARDQVIIR